MSAVVSLSEQEQQFFDSVQQAIDNQNFDRLILSQYKGEFADLEKMTFRVIQLQNEAVLSCLYHYKTKDVTKNYPLNQALSTIQEQAENCKQANLFTAEAETQLKKNKKKAMLTVSKNKPNNKALKNEQQGHDRTKHRFVDQDSYFLQALGVTDADAKIIPSMARKWKQINKFMAIRNKVWNLQLVKVDIYMVSSVEISLYK